MSCRVPATTKSLSSYRATVTVLVVLVLGSNRATTDCGMENLTSTVPVPAATGLSVMATEVGLSFTSIEPVPRSCSTPFLLATSSSCQLPGFRDTNPCPLVSVKFCTFTLSPMSLLPVSSRV